MVNINSTLLVQLGLFLLFLWGLNRLVLRPMLKTMDDREDMLRRQEAETDSDTTQAEQAESTYASRIAAARQEAAQRVEEARRAALGERTAALAQRRAEANGAVERVRGKALEAVDEQRQRYADLAPGLVGAIIEKLGTGGRSE